MKIFERYIIRELIPYTLAGLAIITFIILINHIIQLAGFLIRNSVSLWVFFKVVLNLLPAAAILGVPMAILFGTVLGIGRLSAESEITAFRACGVGMTKFIKPIIIFSVFALLLDLVISIYWLPHSNHQLSNLYQKIIMSRSLSHKIKPRVFIESIPSKVIYISRLKNNNRRWENVIIFDTSKAYEPSIILAKSAVPYDDEAEKGIHLNLQDVNIYDINLRDPVKRSRTSSTPSMFIQLMEPREIEDVNYGSSKNPRAQNIRELEASVQSTYKKNSLILRLQNSTHEEQRIRALLTVKSETGDETFTQIIKMPKFSLEDYEMYFRLPQRKRFRGFDLKIILLKKNLEKRVIFKGSIGHKEIFKLIKEKKASISKNKTRFEIFPKARGNIFAKIKKINIERLNFRKGYQRYQVEIHKKFAIPFACVIFALLGLPLGITSRRAGKSFGYITSVVVFVAYWYLLLNGEVLANTKKIPPWLGAWTANFVFLAIAGIFLMKMSKTKENRILTWFIIVKEELISVWKKVIGFLRNLLIKKTASVRKNIPKSVSADPSGDQNSQGKPRVVLQVSKFYFRFPNTLDRYILKSFIKLFLMVILILYVITVIAEFSEINDEFQNNNKSYSLLWDYYKYRMPNTLRLLIPISALVATLATFGIMSRNNETIAMKASGISQYRMSASIVMMAAVLSLVTYNISEKVLPYSQVKFEEVDRKIRNKETQTFEQIGRQFLFGKPKEMNVQRIFYFYQYNERERKFKKISFYDYNPETMKLTQRLMAERADWDPEFNGWTFRKGSVQKFTKSGFMTEAFENRIYRLDETPEYFKKNWQEPEQMSYEQLQSHIKELKMKGYDPIYEQVRLHWKLAYAIITFVIVMIGIPFSFRMDNKGSLSGIFISLVIIIVFYPMTNVMRQLGYSGVLPPLIAAWGANVFFLLLSFVFMLRMKT